MNMVKKGMAMLLAVCMLVCGSTIQVNAAESCPHTKIKYVYTGQYIYPSYTHTATVGYYSDGKPITVQCSVQAKREIVLVYCDMTNCNQYLFQTERTVYEYHSVVH